MGSNIMDIDTLRSKLTAVGQEHLLQFWEELDTEEKQALYNELSELDLDEVLEYFQRTVAEMSSAGEKLDDKMQPLTESQCGSMAASTDSELDQYETLSLEEISK